MSMNNIHLSFAHLMHRKDIETNMNIKMNNRQRFCFGQEMHISRGEIDRVGSFTT